MSDIPATLDFGDLEPIRIPVRYRGVDYVLKEATNDAIVKYRNAVFKAARVGQDGKIAAWEGIADCEPLLVSMCLFKLVDKDGKGQPLNPVQEVVVSLNAVRNFPNEMVTKLYETAKLISKVEDDDSEEGLVKRIQAMQKRLAEVRARRKQQEGDPMADPTKEDSVPNSPGATTDLSV